MTTNQEWADIARVVKQLAAVQDEHGKIPVDILSEAAERVNRTPRTMQKFVQHLRTDGVIPGPPASRAITLTEEEKKHARAMWFKFAGNMVRAHESLASDPDFPKMSYKTFTRIVETWPEYLNAAACGGFGEMMKCQAVLTEDIPYRTYSYGIDNTKLPIRVRKSARSNQVITAWLTIVLDLYSRTIVAYAIKETSPNAEDILAVLAEAFAVTETPDGLFGGLPGRLRSDNGGDFTSNAVRDALFDLGVIHDRSMVYTPRQNGRVERTNGIIKKRFAPDQPGYAKGADTDLELAMRRSPADIDSLMTLDELNDAFGKWVDEKYHHLKHPELAPLTRLQVWHGSPQPLKEVEEETLWAAMLRRDKRPLHRYGIEIHKSYFQHPELATLWSHSKRKIVLDVRSSRRYPDRIFVFNDGVFLCTAYRAKAMTDEQKGIIRGQHKGQTDKAATYLNEANHARAIEAQEDARIANAQRERATGSTARSPERFDLFDDLDDLEFTDLPNDRKEAS